MLLAGCGGSSRAADPECRAQATKVAEHARSMIVHYGGGTVYPADVSYLLLRGSLRGFEQHDCPVKILGTTLSRRLDARDRATLLRLLAKPTERKIRRALASVP